MEAYTAAELELVAIDEDVITTSIPGSAVNGTNATGGYDSGTTNVPINDDPVPMPDNGTNSTLP